MNEKKNYIVSTKCGHVGNNNYIVIDFPVIARNAREAAKIARNIPRVKHHWKNAIEKVHEVTAERYYKQIEINRNDDYLKAHCIQDQKRACKNLDERIYYSDLEVNETEKWRKRKERIQYQMKKLEVLKKHSYIL